MHLLEMNHIRKTFPGVVALDDVSITLDRGQVLALLGENGAGKSTLIKVLAGVHTADSGNIVIDGVEQHIKNPKIALDAGIAVIYQELCLANDMTVAENIFMGREPKKKNGFIDTAKMNSEAKKILDELGVNIAPTTTLRSLSIAQKQTIEIARCISKNAQIIVMDEPTSSLTENEVKMLFGLIRKMKANNIGIIYISHRMEEIFEICDTVTVLRDGATVGTRQTTEASREELISMMVGRSLSQYYTKDDHVQEEVVFSVRDLVTTRSEHKLSFDLHRGEILGFSGLVGAGRSELMKAIFGSDKKVSGQTILHGELVEIKSPADAIAHGIAMISEERHKEGLVLRNTVEFNASLLCLDQFIKNLRVDKKTEGEIVSEQVDAMRIKISSPQQLAINLSGGNQQKVVLGKWLAKKPEIIIMDEPTRGIDVGSKSEIYEIMNRLTGEGCSIIMVSSELPEILGMSDRVCVMMEGKITAVLDRDELTQEKIMHYSIGGAM